MVVVGSGGRLTQCPSRGQPGRRLVFWLVIRPWFPLVVCCITGVGVVCRVVTSFVRGALPACVSTVCVTFVARYVITNRAHMFPGAPLRRVGPLLAALIAIEIGARGPERKLHLAAFNPG